MATRSPDDLPILLCCQRPCNHGPRFLRRLTRWWVGAILAAGAAAFPAAAAEYPDRPIRLVVPFPAGGGADTLARIIMPGVAQRIGATIVIDNKPGAGGNVGAEIVARSPPDG